MNVDIKEIVMNAKYARIIACMSEMYKISVEDATDIFYNSETFGLIDEGVADLHCRSDKYLAGEIWREHCEH
jgi:hypothetical protein